MGEQNPTHTDQSPFFWRLLHSAKVFSLKIPSWLTDNLNGFQSIKIQS
jgi:hypothetical protein